MSPLSYAFIFMLELYLNQKNNQLQTLVPPFLHPPQAERFALWSLELQIWLAFHRLSLKLQVLELVLCLLDAEEGSWP